MGGGETAQTQLLHQLAVEGRSYGNCVSAQERKSSSSKSGNTGGCFAGALAEDKRPGLVARPRGLGYSNGPGNAQLSCCTFTRQAGPKQGDGRVWPTPQNVAWLATCAVLTCSSSATQGGAWTAVTVNKGSTQGTRKGKVTTWWPTWLGSVDS